MKDTVAIIPGCFSVPHAGHWRMISHYAGVADYAVVLVSAPKAGSREVSDPNVKLSPWKSKAILDVFLKRSGLNNVRIRVSDEPSPVKAALKAMSRLTDCHVVIGYSDKDGAGKYGWVKATPEMLACGVTVADPAKSAFRAEDRVSASDVRRNIRDFERYQSVLPEFLSPGDVDAVRRILYS